MTIRWEELTVGGMDSEQTIRNFYYSEGATIQTVATKLGVDYSTIQRRMKAIGIQLKPHKTVTEGKHLKNLRCLPTGQTAERLAELAGCHKSVVYRYVRDGRLQGVVMPRREKT